MSQARSLSTHARAGRRSLMVHFELARGPVFWGAGIGIASGALAAAPNYLAGSTWLRLAAAWFCAVPLLGTVWHAATALGGPFGGPPIAPEAARHRLPHTTSRRGGPLSRAVGLVRAMAGGVRQVGQTDQSATLDLVGASLLTLLFGYLLGNGVVWLVLASLVALLIAAWHVVPGGESFLFGSLGGFLVPAVLTWLALAGAVAVPAPLAIQEDWLTCFGSWLAANRLTLLTFAALTLVHHGLSRPKPDTTMARGLRIGGYLIAIAILASSERAVGAGLLALLVVLQLPWLMATEAEQPREPSLSYRAWQIASLVAAATIAR